MWCRALPALATVVILSGCGGAAEAQLVSVAPDQVEPRGAVELYELDPSQVKVEVDVSAGTSHTMTFQRTTGTFELAPHNPEASSLTLVVATGTATASIGAVADIGRARFLHVDRHPEATVVTRSMRRAEQGLSVFVDFTLHGTKRTMQVPATITVDPCRARFDCAFTIRRSDFGTVDDGNYEALVSDQVEVRVAVDVPRKGAPARCAAAPPS